MKKLTVLFDLDDTLIADFSTKFMPAYIKALGDWIKELPPEKVVPGIRNATRKMMVKEKASGTLEECFNWHFYSLQELSKKELSPVINSFYETRFPELKSNLKPIPEIREMMEKIREMGHDIAIATNPLFPRVATINRVFWAGFSESEISNFDLITTYEDFHFCKPNPAYYAEVLGRMGWKDQPVVMIGDSLDMDIRPAEGLGFATYWVDVQESSNGRNRLSSGGSRNEIPDWIHRVSQSVKTPSANQSMLSAVITSTPAILDGLFRSGASNKSEQLHLVIDDLIKRDFQVFEVLSSKYRVEPNGTSPDEAAEEKNYLSFLGPELGKFFSSRQKLLQLIKNIPSQMWENVEIFSLISDLALNDQERIRGLKN